MRIKKLVFLFSIYSLLLIYSQAVYAQSVFPTSNGIALEGQTEFDSYAVTTLWLGVEMDQETFDSNLESAFHLGLRRDGVIVDSSAPNFLGCIVRVVQERSLVFYSYDVDYYLYNPEGLHVLAWSAGGAVKVGINNFDHESVASNCVDIFSNEWLKQNPKR